jgi:hypothetical protein
VFDAVFSSVVQSTLASGMDGSESAKRFAAFP